MLIVKPIKPLLLSKILLSLYGRRFRQTRSDKTNLEVRFKKRLADKKTFFEEGMLKYWTTDSEGNDNISYLEFEAVWIKKGREWLMIMEIKNLFR